MDSFMRSDILSFSLEELKTVLISLGEEKYRAGQIFNWLHVKKITDFSEITNVSEQLRQKLTNNFYINPPIIQKKLVSNDKNTVKYLYELHDGEGIETVFMSYRHGNSLCISTQAGCKMNCSFCASCADGFSRNLKPSEMLSQIYETERISTKTVNSVVLMGIGEPLDNFDNVIKFLNILSDKNGRNMSMRHVSLSTCGLADKIDALADLKLGLTLSVSLHAVDDETRDKLMPINKTFNIERLLASCKNYFEKTGRRVSFEYALIKNINDNIETAEKLARLIKPLHAHINLILVNKINKSIYTASESVKNFEEHLIKRGVNATIRRTLGIDIDAACGQLRLNKINNSKL